MLRASSAGPAQTRWGLLFVLLVFGAPVLAGPRDDPFSKKPPLNFWKVAGAMRASAPPRTGARMCAPVARFRVSR